MKTNIAFVMLVMSICMLAADPAAASLPTGYLVWIKGTLDKSETRKLYRMTLPQKTDIKVLTSGEDVEPQISPDGKWVAYAKAILSGGTDYHSFKAWSLYLVSINGGKEIKIADKGYWPSWGQSSNVLYYSVADGDHTEITKANLDAQGNLLGTSVVVSTKSTFSQMGEINECFVSPDGSWFAARTRGGSYGSVGAYQLSGSPKYTLLGKTQRDTGCFPGVARSGTWGFCSAAEWGIRWADAPSVNNRKQDQVLVPVEPSAKYARFPSVSSDEKWVLAGMSSSSNQNSGAWDIYIYNLDASTKKVSNGQKLVSGEFNGWSSLWVGNVSSTGPAPSQDGGTSLPDGGTPPPPITGGDDSSPGADDLPPGTGESSQPQQEVTPAMSGLAGGCSVVPNLRSKDPTAMLLLLLLALALAARRPRL
jgi:hypothetical protein